MAASSLLSGLTATAPTFSVRGPHSSLLLEMTGLGPSPPSGSLLRGLTPYLDEQGAQHVLLLTERRRREPWSSDPQQVHSYQELIHWARSPEGGLYRGVCGKGGGLTRAEVVQAFEYAPLELVDWAARRLNEAVVSCRAPLLLKPCTVPKPWGAETWYTGIESRGVSHVQSGTGSTELPYALGMFPVPLLGAQEALPILLKSLEPLPDPVYGDLYLEVHQQKWEVYVVLAVDPHAWPDGTGALRAGLDPDTVAAYQEAHGDSWADALTQELQRRIAAYEAVRRQLDDRLDQTLTARGEDPAQPVAPALHSTLLAGLPSKLRDQEQTLREAVEALLGRVPLRVGDVVTLAPGVLHSLQHGVRVIEFQTPTYERLIAMFAQKVLTQPHWDSAEALRQMNAAVYKPPTPVVIEESAGLRREQIVDFPQFQVQRLHIGQGTTLQDQSGGGNRYRLLFVTEGRGNLTLPDGGIYTLEQGAALLLPACLGRYGVEGIASAGVTYLQAEPSPENGAPPAVSVDIDAALERTW